MFYIRLRESQENITERTPNKPQIKRGKHALCFLIIIIIITLTNNSKYIIFIRFFFKEISNAEKMLPDIFIFVASTANG
jgi:hypothetical protein